MNKTEFIDKTLNKLFEGYLPPGYEEVKNKIEERFSVPSQKVNKKAWTVYRYDKGDRPDIQRKLQYAALDALNEAMQNNSVEFGLLAPEDADYEIERVFQARDEERALQSAIEWAEEQGYDVERPGEGAESIFDWRFDGRRLTQID